MNLIDKLETLRQHGGPAFTTGLSDETIIAFAERDPRLEQAVDSALGLFGCLREEFDAPHAPFVLTTIGFGGEELAGHGLTVLEAQLAVDGDRGKYPEFEDNVKAIDTRAFWRDQAVSPLNQGYHYNQNAETSMSVGEALGRGMVELLERRAAEAPSKR